MAHSIKEQLQSPIIDLRANLDRAERLVPQLTKINVEEFLRLLDTLDTQFDQTATSGLDLRPERTRLLSLHSRLERRPNDLVSAARGVGGLATLRQRHPPATGFWWHLDAVVAERRRQQLRRLLTTVGVLVLVLGGLYFVVETFFPPDPNVVAVSAATGSLTDLAINGEWEAALVLIDETKATITVPDAEILIWEGVVADHLGLAERSAAALDAARDLVGAANEALFWVNLGNVRLMSNDLDKAQAAAEQALVIDESEAQAYFLLGGVAESRGDVRGAIDNYERTFELAADSNPQLAGDQPCAPGHAAAKRRWLPDLPRGHAGGVEGYWVVDIAISTTQYPISRRNSL